MIIAKFSSSWQIQYQLLTLIIPGYFQNNLSRGGAIIIHFKPP